MSGTATPEPSGRRTSAGLGLLVTLALVGAIGLVGVRGLQSASQAPAVSPSPPTSSVAEVPSPLPSPSATPAPSPDDSTTARTVATRYETARASGDWQTAWSMLSAYSQGLYGSLAAFERIESAYNASGGSTFEIADPTRSPDLFAPEFLGQAYLDATVNADIDRAWLVMVNHPDVKGASAASTGLLIAPIGDRWSVWIAR